MKELLKKDPAKALDIIMNSYMALHPKSGATDMMLAQDFFVNKTSVKDIARKWHYNEQTIYNKVNYIEAYAESYKTYEYVILPRAFQIDNCNMRLLVYKIVLMTMSIYQQFGETSIKRSDLVCRFPALTHAGSMNEVAEDMKKARGVYTATEFDLAIFLMPGLVDEFNIYDSASYEDSFLKFKFTDMMQALLVAGKYLGEHRDAAGEL